MIYMTADQAADLFEGVEIPETVKILTAAEMNAHLAALLA